MHIFEKLKNVLNLAYIEKFRRLQTFMVSSKQFIGSGVLRGGEQNTCLALLFGGPLDMFCA